MEMYIIARWDSSNPKTRITNRVDISDYELLFEYSSNQTSSFTIAYPNSVMEDINSGDLVYVPDYKFSGVVHSYDKDTYKLTVGNVLNVYQFPQALPGTVYFEDAAGALFDNLTQFSELVMPEMKVDMFNWSMDAMDKTDTTISFNDTSDYSIVDFWEFASKLILKSRGTRTQVKGIRIVTDGIANTQNGIQFNMRLTQTEAVKTEFAYAPKEDSHRFITNLEVNDKMLTINSVILFDKNGNQLSQWYLNLSDGSVSKGRPPKDQYPVYIGGYIHDPTQEDAPSELQVATGQLPVNQSDSFTFDIPMSQEYIDYNDVMVNTYITMKIVEGTTPIRVLTGVVSSLKVTPDLMTVTAGLAKPKLKLQL